MKNDIEIYIGIDPGVKTGVAIWDSYKKEFIAIETLMIHEAFDQVIYYHNHYNCKVIVEDARLRKWFGVNSKQKMQGAGSVKRDCKAWEDFLKQKEVNHTMQHPIKGGTKLDKVQFKKLTGWSRQTSEHSRDASMLVYKR